MGYLVLFALVQLGLGLLISVRLKARIPTKVSGSSGLDNFSVGPALKHMDLLSIRVAKHAESVASFVLLKSIGILEIRFKNKVL